MIDGRFRATFEKGLRPVGQNIRRTGITADQLTAFGGVMALAAAIAIGGFGNLLLGLFFLTLSAVPDVLDGAVAKASGTASARGAFFDSVMDRVSDALLFGGVAWYFSNKYGGAWPMLPVGVLALSMLISYERARAESLNFDARGGVMERAERIIALGIGLLFEVLLIPVLFLMLLLTAYTAGQRFVKVWKQASIERPQTVRMQRRAVRRRAARTVRRNWRDGRAPSSWRNRGGKSTGR
ncbi:MAG: CDP-alcohol phosphatidyltransferase family protein [Actinobacteria bacterium]|nr:CDP-alcohol phosphatidyltransferase family protein [Actinomycetota bacterium]